MKSFKIITPDNIVSFGGLQWVRMSDNLWDKYDNVFRSHGTWHALLKDVVIYLLCDDSLAEHINDVRYHSLTNSIAIEFYRDEISGNVLTSMGDTLNCYQLKWSIMVEETYSDDGAPEGPGLTLQIVL